jgi:hypothetical protein
MALIELNTHPSPRQLAVFGGIFPLFFGLLGGAVYQATGSLVIPVVLWSVAGAVTASFALFKSTRLPIYRGWLRLTFPIGWTISALLLAVTYYAVLTPIGLVMRALGWDPMRRRYDREASSYFRPHRKVELPHYFRQF